MAGTIAADTLTHSTAGSIATNFVVEGSCKSWVSFNGTGTIASRDTFNVSGLLDNTDGDYDVNFTSAMNNGNYSTGGNSADPSTISQNFIVGSDRSTSDCRVRTLYPANTSGAGTVADAADICLQVFGDLA